LEDYLKALLTVSRIEDLKMRFAAVVTRYEDGTSVFFNTGEVAPAVRASAASQSGWVGKFMPLHIEGECYVDGDVAQPLPVRAARALGAQFVIAVDVSAYLDNVPKAAVVYRATDLEREKLIEPDRAGADILIHPDIGYWANTNRTYRERVMATAYKETMRWVPEIQRRLATLATAPAP
jgi:NTE family protein